MLINRKTKWLLGILTITFGTTFWFMREVAPSPLTDKEKIVIETLFANPKPQCMGRYIIDVPESFNNELNNRIVIDDFNIESQFLYPPAFKQRVALRELELLNESNKPRNKINNGSFIKEIIVLPENKGFIFDRNQSGSYDSYRKLEAHFYVNMIAFIITTDILDLSNPKYTEEKKSYLQSGFQDFETNTKPAKLAAMKSLISRLSGRNNEDIPTEKGVCIPNGFIADDGNRHQENIYFGYSNDDFVLSFNTNNTIPISTDTLLSRSFQFKKALALDNKHTIKKGNLSPNEIPSVEWLVTGNQDIYSEERKRMSVPYYYFIFYGNEGVSSPTAPFLDIGLNNEGKKTGYTDAEMVEIWDRIINSLRYRPNSS